MIPTALKNLYYGAMQGPMWVNGRLYKAFRQPRDGTLNVHLGCGKERYIPGWLNVDANLVSAKIDLWINFLDKLPFRDNSVDRFYSFHVVEHLPERHLATHFADMFRCVKPGGGIRIGGPHIENAARKFVEGDAAWFSDFPINRKSVGGRFANFVFCSGEHLTALSPSFLRELAEDAGFVDCRTCLPIRESAVVGQEILSTEYEDDFECPHTVVIEARKPQA